MRKYFVDGMQISQKQARDIEMKNLKYINSGDFQKMSKIKFIIVV